MERVAVVARLKPGSADKARALIEQGPPFDPDELDLERHSVYVSEDHVVFIFEGGRANALVSMVAQTGTAAPAFAEWDRILDGLPALSQEAYSWERNRDPAWAGGWGE